VLVSVQPDHQIWLSFNKFVTYKDKHFIKVMTHFTHTHYYYWANWKYLLLTHIYSTHHRYWITPVQNRRFNPREIGLTVSRAGFLKKYLDWSYEVYFFFTER
jgi:hypothetical protein